MNKLNTIQRLVTLGLAMAVLSPLSLFAEQRPYSRTNDGYYNNSGSSLRGTVLSVSGDGDDILLDTRNQRVRIDASGGVDAIFNGRRLRVRDLRPGDVVIVTLRSERDRYPRARSIQVIQTAAGRNGNYGYNQGAGDQLFGRVVSLDLRRDLLILRTTGGRAEDILVNLRQANGAGGERSRTLRTGDYITVDGSWRGRTFMARNVSQSGNRNGNYDDRYGRH
ncbi:MAG: hypothetical protein ABI718_12140 [Acidobacteriota bacterium]